MRKNTPMPDSNVKRVMTCGLRHEGWRAGPCLSGRYEAYGHGRQAHVQWVPSHFAPMLVNSEV